MATTLSNGQTGNRLLDAVDHQGLDRLAPHLESTPMAFKQVLHKPGGKVSHAYFFTGGVASVTKVLSDGAMIEVGTAGRDGMIGVGLFLGETVASNEALVQIPGPMGWRIPAGDFMAELGQRGRFWDLMRRYTLVCSGHWLQSVACNGLHNVEERCCRWLLTTQDRVGSDHVRLTQEFLAVMLGVRRPTVTIVLGTLEKAGLLELHRGEIHIVDRKRLEEASCECYRSTVDDYQRLLPECVGRHAPRGEFDNEPGRRRTS
jgi:CRP-like cAMP-binding protein